MEEQEVVSTEVAEEAVEETEVKEPETEVAEVVEPPKKTAQERINELTRKRREAEREAEYWKSKATQPETPKAEATGEPTLDQFETTEQYVKALVKWERKQEESETRAAKEKREEEEALASFQRRADKLRAEAEDFDEVVESTPFTPYMRKTIANSDNGPAVAYYLGQNKEIAEKLCSLSPEKQIYELGKLETKILLAKETKKVSTAPKPISPVGMGGGAKEKSPSEMTDEEYWAWDKKQFEEKIKKKYGG